MKVVLGVAGMELNVLHSGQCSGACASGFSWKHGDNWDVSAVAEQSLPRVKASSASQSTPPVRRLAVHRMLGGNRGQLTPADYR